jgi:hypothetical protein
MSAQDEDDKDVVDRLRALRPRVPEDAKFWEDFGREVRVAYDARPRRRFRLWPWLAPLPLAGAAALFLVMRGTTPPADPPVEPPRQAAPLPLPQSDDVEELGTEDLDEVLVDLQDELDEDVDVEDLNDDELSRVYDALKGA